MHSETVHSDSAKPLVSLSYWSVVESVLKDNGIEQDWMQTHPGLALARETGRLRCQDYESLLLLSQKAFGPTLGVETGLRGYPTKHGALGIGLMSCATLGQALEFGVRYQHARMPYYDVEVQAESPWLDIDVYERIELPGLQHFGITSACTEICTLLRTLVPIHPDQLQVFFDMPEPPYFALYRDRMPRCTFGSPVNRVAIRMDALSLRLPSANAQALREASEQCEAELVRLGIAGSWREQVLVRLQDAHQAPRTIAQMAAALHVSERTLKRHLQREGCTFKSLQDTVRMRAARALLAEPGLAIADIAQRVGFEDPAHFTRAFRRWTGHPPSALRAHALS